MPSTIVMPQMGYDMQEGRVVRWLKREGDSISRGEEIAEIETDKAVIPMPSTAEGVVSRLLVSEGEMVPVGQGICVVAAPGESPSGDGAPTAAAPAAAAAPAPAPAPQSATAGPSGPVRASPLARRVAEEMGVDLALVEGSGPNGRITERDVRAFAERAATAQPSAAPPAATGPALGLPKGPASEPVPAASPGEPQSIQLNRLRQAVARTTARSWQEAPHFFVVADVDMEAAMSLRQQVNAALEPRGVRASVNDLVIRACVEALKLHPQFNATYRGDRLEVHPSINIGVAIDLEGRGLIQPAIMRCEGRSLADIAAASRDLAQRAREDHLRADEYTESTFTVSNLGMFGVLSFTAVIAPPNCAILAVGAVQPRAVVREGQVVARQTMTVTLSVDHRVNDGAAAARFVADLKRLLENPISLLV